jgi:TRAP-type C4-dicarboxylate transport system permease small subunit
MSAAQDRPAFDRVLGYLGNVLAVLAGLSILFLMFLTVADVVGRQFFATSVRGTIEITEVALTVAVFLGMIGAEISKSHIRTPLILDRLPPRIAGVLNAIGLVVVLILLGWMIVVTTEAAFRAIELGEYRFGLLAVPVWPAKLAIPFGLAAMALALVQEFMNAVRAAIKRERLDPIEMEGLL